MMLRRVALICLILRFPALAFVQETGDSRSRQPADALEGPPLVTAKAWVIGDGGTGRRLWGAEEETPRAIASTTKIMTAWLVLQLCEQDQARLNEAVTFSERADKTGGTTAGIQAGEALPARDLLFGLLLPSGNDAAVALAEHFGRFFVDAPDGEPSEEECLAAFITQMNRTVKELEMPQTHYLDPHGLGGNRSSAYDLLRLAHAAMQSETFRSYVQTSRHQCMVTTADGSLREAAWNNTNQLLRIEGYDGVKTGTTNAAGSCLVASCRRGDDHLLVVVLGSTSNEGRYIDARNLLRWAWLERRK
jgi:D-alanyl-D-alanine carboxypeptidase (penicillin-binding protein 5/6)